jgi:hypothetical protein
MSPEQHDSNCSGRLQSGLGGSTDQKVGTGPSRGHGQVRCLLLCEVDSGRPAGISTGGFPRAASRTRRASRPGTGLSTSPVDGADGVASPGSPVPDGTPRRWRPPARRYSPTSSRHSSISTTDLLAPFAMYVPLARSDYYEASAPPDGPQSATDLPRRRTGCPAGRATAGGSHVHRIIDRPDRRSAIPRQHRHTYAVDLQRGLPTVCCTRLRS